MPKPKLVQLSRVKNIKWWSRKLSVNEQLLLRDRIIITYNTAIMSQIRLYADLARESLSVWNATIKFYDFEGDVPI